MSSQTRHAIGRAELCDYCLLRRRHRVYNWVVPIYYTNKMNVVVCWTPLLLLLLLLLSPTRVRAHHNGRPTWYITRVGMHIVVDDLALWLTDLLSNVVAVSRKDDFVGDYYYCYSLRVQISFWHGKTIESVCFKIRCIYLFI